MGCCNGKIQEPVLEPITTHSYNPTDLRERWLEFRAAMIQQSKRNRLGSFSNFRRAISESSAGTDLQFDQFQEFVTKYFSENDEFKSRLLDAFDFEEGSRISFTEAAVCINILQASSAEEKLKFLFDVFDSNGDGALTPFELKGLLQQVTASAASLGYTSSTLCTSIAEVMTALDRNDDGRISSQEWMDGCQASPPLMAFLGVANRASCIRPGCHDFRLKNFRHQVYCNKCNETVSGLVRRGFVCNLCGFVLHEGCFDGKTAGCRPTSVEQPDPSPPNHFWLDGNVGGKCIVCSRSMGSRSPTECSACVWCGITIHPSCRAKLPPEQCVCTLGSLSKSIIPASGFIIAPNRSRRNSVAIPNDDSALALSGIRPRPDSSPIVAFVNSRSGAGQGLQLIRTLRRLLNPRQVFDLADGGPNDGLVSFKDVPGIRVVCCGGDGTVGWVLASLDRIAPTSRPPVGVIPLGTGNDLARALNWGGGYAGEDISKLLLQMESAQISMLDRWTLSFTQTNLDDEKSAVPLTILNNYFSIGVDAAIALKFHQQRESNPQKFSSRTKNKVYYAQYGAEEVFRSTCANLEKQLELEVDGEKIELPVIQGLIFLNISSMYGGTNLWGTRVPANFKPQNSGDGLIEIVAVFGSAHVGQIKGGLRGSAHRIKQGSVVKITTKSALPMQVDGEPWTQSSCVIDISLLNQQPMLQKEKEEGTRLFRHSSQHDLPHLPSRSSVLPDMRAYSNQIKEAGELVPPPSNRSPQKQVNDLVESAIHEGAAAAIQQGAGMSAGDVATLQDGHLRRRATTAT